MQQDMELQQVLYQLFKTQIRFGAHRYGEPLPTIRQTSEYFMVSVDTVRLVYLRLKQEGYISLSTCVGARVKADYSEEVIRQNIQSFFACRKGTLTDLAAALGPMCRFAHWFALKNSSEKTLDELERSCGELYLSPVYRMLKQLKLSYRSLGNELFMRLMWQIFLFFQAPFLSTPQNIEYFRNTNPLLGMVRLCRQKDWAGLWDAVGAYQTQLIKFLGQFYSENIQEPSPGEPVAFSWSVHKRASQICYSLCLDLLLAMGRGAYPEGSLLPPPARLAQEKQIALNTVRRTYGLLGKLGAVRPVNGVGTRVLPPMESAENSDMTDPLIQKRLLEFAQGCQFLALSCRACAQATLAAMEAASVTRWLESLEEVERKGVYETLLYTCYAFISAFAPYQAIRTVYAQLLRMLFWGFPLRKLHGEREAVNAHFRPYLDAMKSCLCRSDWGAFAEKLEELQITETRFIAEYLKDLGIREAGALLIPSRKV